MGVCLLPFSHQMMVGFLELLFDSTPLEEEYQGWGGIVDPSISSAPPKKCLTHNHYEYALTKKIQRSDLIPEPVKDSQ
jgi:hypothetical protein